MKKIIFFGVLAGWCFGTAPFLHAESSSEELDALRQQIEQLTQTIGNLQTQVQDQQKRIQDLEEKNQELEGRTVTASPQPPTAQAPAGVGWTDSLKQSLSAFNPEIGLLADVAAILSQSDEDSEGNDKASVREIELIMGHDIDPYARFDSVITLSDFEDVEIEEAYITPWNLPWDLRGRIGRMRPKVGKAAALHRDALDTADEPLVVQNFFGVEGFFRTGLELSWFIPFPWEIWTHELTLGVLEGGVGEGGALFGETRRRPSFYAHLKNFWDISDASNFELGGTYLLGSSDEDSKYEVNAFGIDATFFHYFDSIHRLKVQSEFYFQDRDEPFVGDEELEAVEEELASISFEDNPWGLYSLVDYRLSPRWSAGGRFDYLIPAGIDLDAPDEADVAGSVYLTFHQSEFARWRLQYQHVEFADGGDDDRIFLQGTIAIGVHKHQLQ